MFIFLYAPIMALAVFSFNDSKSMGKWEGFTFKWYQSLFQDERIMTALFYTIVIAVVASLVATIIGTITAIGIHNMKRGKLKKVILNVNNLPILNPDVVTGVSLMTLFVFLNVEFGFKTILLSHIVFNIPYVILSVLPKLKQLPPNIEDAAMDLGATPMYALKKVVIPQIKPGIISGMLIAFTMSIDDFVISFFTAGNGVTNLSIEIYSMTRRGISPEINALSTIMFVVVLILLILSNVSGKKQPVLNKE
ncbi:Inner membrane ABC transporter permease protein ydcV [uncultured Clostridium sp.]|nr:Inner membrane ABC transporter permease protein ydcV [uncultured Clostridium sp.]